MIVSFNLKYYAFTRDVCGPGPQPASPRPAGLFASPHQPAARISQPAPKKAAKNLFGNFICSF